MWDKKHYIREYAGNCFLVDRESLEIVPPTRLFIDVMENLCLPAQQVKPKAATFTPSKTDLRNSKRRIVAFDEKNLDDEEQEEECMPRSQWKTLEGDKASIPAIESGDVEIETFEEEEEEEDEEEEEINRGGGSRTRRNSKLSAQSFLFNVSKVAVALLNFKSIFR